MSSAAPSPPALVEGPPPPSHGVYGLVAEYQNFKSFMACGRSGSLMSLICWEMFMFIFLTAETARAGAAERPAYGKGKS